MIKATQNIDFSGSNLQMANIEIQTNGLIRFNVQSITSTGLVKVNGHSFFASFSNSNFGQLMLANKKNHTILGTINTTNGCTPLSAIGVVSVIGNGALNNYTALSDDSTLILYPYEYDHSTSSKQLTISNLRTSNPVNAYFSITNNSIYSSFLVGEQPNLNFDFTLEANNIITSGPNLDLITSNSNFTVSHQGNSLDNYESFVPDYGMRSQTLQSIFTAPDKFKFSINVFSASVTPSRSPSNSGTPSPTNTPTKTPTSSVTPSKTPTPSISVTGTPTNTPTRTNSNTPSTSSTASESTTGTPSATSSKTSSGTTTPTPTSTPSTTNSAPVTPSNTPTPSMTPSPGASQSGTPSTTATAIPSPTGTQTPTGTGTDTPSPSSTISVSPTSSNTVTPSVSPTNTPSNTASTTGTNTPSNTPSDTPTNTPTPTSTGTSSVTSSSTQTPSDTPSISNSNTSTSSSTESPSISNTPTPSLSSSPSVSSSGTQTKSTSVSNTISRSKSSSRSQSLSFSASRTPSISNSSSMTVSISEFKVTTSQTPTNSITFSISNSISSTTSIFTISASISEIPPSPSASNSAFMDDIAPPIPMSVSPTQIVLPSQVFVQTNTPSASRSPTFISQPCSNDVNSQCGGLVVTDVVSPSGSVIIIENPDLNIIGQSDTSNVFSFVVNVRLEDENADLGGDVEICIESTAEANEDLCLGFLDESSNPPKWKCEDPCLQKNSDGLLCGNTDHFTNFALLLNGGSGKNKGCGSDSDKWITGSGYGDLILVLSCALFCIAFGIIFIIAVNVVPPVKRIAYGREGMRIAKSRDVSRIRSGTDTIPVVQPVL